MISNSIKIFLRHHSFTYILVGAQCILCNFMKFLQRIVTTSPQLKSLSHDHQKQQPTVMKFTRGRLGIKYLKKIDPQLLPKIKSIQSSFLEATHPYLRNENCTRLQSGSIELVRFRVDSYAVFPFINSIRQKIKNIDVGRVIHFPTLLFPQSEQEYIELVIRVQLVVALASVLSQSPGVNNEKLNTDRLRGVFDR